MAVEQLTYAALAERLAVSPEAARALAKRHRLPRQRANDGKTLLAVDLAEIAHKPLPARAPRGDRPDATRIANLEAEITRLQATAGGHRADVTVLQAELARLQAAATRDRQDFERERERAERLVSELLASVADAMRAREETARLEGVLAAWRARSWWQRLLAV